MWQTILIEAQIKEGENGDVFKNENEICEPTKNLLKNNETTMKEMEHFILFSIL